MIIAFFSFQIVDMAFVYGQVHFGFLLYRRKYRCLKNQLKSCTSRRLGYLLLLHIPSKMLRVQRVHNPFPLTR
uniref:Uncharacterized protein n=1 Tax=Enterococcus faecium TaxID=1352 RepID=Q848U4_ENTFC|nr:hypothetical protein [Enterococcus faecium]ADV60049.1 conserved hypothetical protein [Enterococcus faecium]APC57435.1 hypothetical protein [Enterococcus faecium]ARJ34056.1 hypothetical protein [Enterococcus faecium]ARJ34109.1 hypothetical protein [Enterococcus faecium]